MNVFLKTENHRIDCNLTEILFLGERKTFDRAEHSWGVANAWDHTYAFHSKTCYLPQNTEPSIF